IIQGEMNATDPGIDWFPGDNDIELEVGKTYRVSMMIKVLSSGNHMWTTGNLVGQTFPASISSFGRALNGWGGLGMQTNLNTFAVNQWVEYSFTFLCTSVPNVDTAFPVLRFQGECDVLLDNVYVTEEP
ncbi:MAG: hypothetical protein AAF616_07895, partial [Bacteroidota bacterium]